MVQRFLRLLLGAALLAGVLIVPAAPASAAEVYERPANGVFPLVGHGWGHGAGLSQWGAYGGASQGRSAYEILDFYYPGTVRAWTAGGDVRVLLEQMGGTAVGVQPRAGLRFTYFVEGSGGWNNPQAPASLVCGAVDNWRVAVVQGDVQVQGSCDRGASWVTWIPASGVDARYPVVLSSAESFVGIASPAGRRAGYRGEVRLQLGSGTLSATNHVPYEQYLRSVVPNEVSASWPAASLQAQAVAARSYALREARDRRGTSFDVYDSTRSQVYPGALTFDGWWNVREWEEDSRTDAAVAATGGVFLSHAGIPAFTQFSASNGGWTAKGSNVPYQRVAADPWDRLPAGNTRKDWTDQVTAAELESRFPAIGSLRRIHITQRDGGGDWGGRVLTAVLEGTSGNRTVSGDSAIRSAFGAYSSYLTIVPVPTSPFGQLEQVTQVPGGLLVSGWVIDPDATGPLPVVLHVDGRGYLTSTGQPRPDVAAAYPAYGSNHGYSVTVPAGPGTHSVCAYGSNVGPGQSTLLGCRDVTSATDPVGQLDRVTSEGTGLRVQGWTLDPDSADPLYALLTVDSRQHLATANAPRPDVAAVYPGYGPNHGIDAVLPAGGPGSHTVCAWGSNVGPGLSTLHGCRGVTTGGSPLGNLELVQSAPGGVRLAGWSLDPDTAAPLYLVAVVDGVEYLVRADASRPDVAAAHPGWGASHGFDLVLPVGAGRHSVCVHASNVGAGSSRLLGCGTAG